MLNGTTIKRPDKLELCERIAKALGVPVPREATGGTIDSAFLDVMHAAIAGRPSGATDTYRRTERVLQALGLTYDPYWDTSEAAPNGGGTVTVRAFSRILSAITGIPRCFILNVTDAPVGAKWEIDHESVYRYDHTVSGRQALNNAGPGSRVIYYSTHNAKHHRMTFSARADVHYIASGWSSPWSAHLTGYEALPVPVPAAQVSIPGWNRQNAITEISWDTYRALLSAGGLELDAPQRAPRVDPGADVIAERVAEDFPPDAAPDALAVPDELPGGTLSGREPRRLHYLESPTGVAAPGAPPAGGRSPADRKRDKAAEQRAVQIATAALAAGGWKLAADRQAEGVGYDLEFARDGRTLKVEVKGIQGRDVAFNLTPKEWWRAETDPEWVVVAVTNVLSPRAFAVHLLARDTVLEADRVVTGYRVRPGRHEEA